MASARPLMSPPSDQCQPTADQDLSSDAIQQLLLEAEKRLRYPTGSPAEDDTDGQISLATKPANPSLKPCIPKLSPGSSLEPYVHQDDDVATVDTSRLVTEGQKRQSNMIHHVECKEDVVAKAKKDKITAGSEWFDLPKTDLSAELKRDLQLLRMRSVLDPKRHYKKENGKGKAPEFSHVGTLVEGPTEFFTSRIAKKDRKRTFVDETLAAEESNSRFKEKYQQIQAKKTSGKKSHYKALLAKRKSGSRKFG
ncbi:hypothetical protein FQN54_001924 [Arachnomyces sp. PD_36]|nr:hypothetical protein FQN54_001924 [Arachnomyces sp. PD_36]